MFLIFLFALLGIALFRMAAACRDEEGFMLISGVTLLVVGQAAANMLMVCGCLPVIGVPLSFISYGWGWRFRFTRRRLSAKSAKNCCAMPVCRPLCQPLI